MQLTKFIVLVALLDLGTADYNLVDTYQPDAFFSKFNFFSVSEDNRPPVLKLPFF